MKLKKSIFIPILIHSLFPWISTCKSRFHPSAWNPNDEILALNHDYDTHCPTVYLDKKQSLQESQTLFYLDRAFLPRNWLILIPSKSSCGTGVNSNAAMLSDMQKQRYEPITNESD